MGHIPTEIVGRLPDLLSHVEHVRRHLSQQCSEVGVGTEALLHERGMNGPRRGVVCRTESGSIQRGVPIAPVCSSNTSHYKQGVWFGAVLLHPRVELLNAFDRREDGDQMPLVECSKRSFELCRSL